MSTESDSPEKRQMPAQRKDADEQRLLGEVVILSTDPDFESQLGSDGPAPVTLLADGQRHTLTFGCSCLDLSRESQPQIEITSNSAEFQLSLSHPVPGYEPGGLVVFDQLSLVINDCSRHFRWEYTPADVAPDPGNRDGKAEQRHQRRALTGIPGRAAAAKADARSGVASASRKPAPVMEIVPHSFDSLHRLNRCRVELPHSFDPRSGLACNPAAAGESDESARSKSWIVPVEFRLEFDDHVKSHRHLLTTIPRPIGHLLGTDLQQALAKALQGIASTRLRALELSIGQPLNGMTLSNLLYTSIPLRRSRPESGVWTGCLPEDNFVAEELLADPRSELALLLVATRQQTDV